MRHGHRAINKPVLDLIRNRVYITIHNHGYAVDPESIRGTGFKVWAVQPDDGTVEGLVHERLPILTTRFHPESKPGPLDANWVFDESLGPEMMSIGEVMGISRTLEETWQKAVRMLDIGEPGLVGGRIYEEASVEEAIKVVKERKPYWFLYAAVLLREGITIDEINEWTGVDKFFLNAIRRVAEFYEGLRKGEPLPLEEAYVLGFSEERLRKALGSEP